MHINYILRIIVIIIYFADSVNTVSLAEAYEIRKRVRNDLDAPRHIYRSKKTIESDIENSPSLFIGDDGEFHIAPPINKLKQYLELAKERIDFERGYHHRRIRISNV
uniref:Secreted protein n=1 Tax=Strongyloides stercoralis TaxID=6248 RepID=A0A0K0EG83_STRER